MSELSPNDPAFDISDEADVRSLLAAEQAHFWHRARNRYILRRLAALGVPARGRILELGCGAGCVAAELSKAGYEVTGIDGHRSLLDVAARRAPAARFACRDLRAGVPELSGERFDVVGLFDVIEHLDDPVEALTQALGWVGPGGYLVGSVPAMMALWSGVDVHAGHKTRYSVRTLRGVLERVGSIEICEITPFFRALVPLLWAQRKVVGRRGDAEGAVQNLTVPPWPINAVLSAVTLLEEGLEPWLCRTPVPGASLWFASCRTA